MVANDVVLRAGEAVPLGEEFLRGDNAAFRAAEVAALDDEVRLAGDGGIDERREPRDLVLAMTWMP